MSYCAGRSGGTQDMLFSCLPDLKPALLYCIESIVHIVNQCPFYCRERTAMYDRIYEKCPNAENAFKNDPQYIPYYMLGRRIQNFEENEMIWLWRISGEFINIMYKKAISNRMGIG